MSYFCNAVVILFPEQIPCFKLADWSASVKEAQRISFLFKPLCLQELAKAETFLLKC